VARPSCEEARRFDARRLIECALDDGAAGQPHQCPAQVTELRAHGPSRSTGVEGARAGAAIKASAAFMGGWPRVGRNQTTGGR